MAFVANNPAYAAANRAEFEASTGEVYLPEGTIYVDQAPILTYANNDTNFYGGRRGTTIKNNKSNGNYQTQAAMVIWPGSDGTAAISFLGFDTPPPAQVSAGEIGWVFNTNGDGSGLYPGEVYRYKPGESIVWPQAGANAFMRAYHGVEIISVSADARTVTVPSGHGLSAGDDVFCTDGPLINELDPDWRTIASTTATTITFTQPLDRTYLRGTICAGAFPRRIAFYNINFDAVGPPLYVQQAVDINCYNCRFLYGVTGAGTSGWVYLIGSARVNYYFCNFDAYHGVSASHDVLYNNCSLNHVTNEQAARRFTYYGCTFAFLDTRIRCVDYRIDGCSFTGESFIYDNWTVSNIHCTGVCTVRGGGAVVTDVTCVGTYLTAVATYSGQPPGSGQNITLRNVIADTTWFQVGTTGRYSNCTNIADFTSGGWVEE